MPDLAKVMGNHVGTGAVGGSMTTPPPSEQPKRGLRRVKARTLEGADVFTDSAGNWYIDELGTGEAYPSQREAEAALAKEKAAAKKKGDT
jgi:hypothetical protein